MQFIVYWANSFWNTSTAPLRYFQICCLRFHPFLSKVSSHCFRGVQSKLQLTLWCLPWPCSMAWPPFHVSHPEAQLQVQTFPFDLRWPASFKAFFSSLPSSHFSCSQMQKEQCHWLLCVQLPLFGCCPHQQVPGTRSLPHPASVPVRSTRDGTGAGLGVTQRVSGGWLQVSDMSSGHCLPCLWASSCDMALGWPTVSHWGFECAGRLLSRIQQLDGSGGGEIKMIWGFLEDLLIYFILFLLLLAELSS